jgi:hypothetical protein
MPEDIQTLSPDEISGACDALRKLSVYFVDRGKLRGCYFTLGAASYIDASSDGVAQYRRRFRKLNPILTEHFGWLYDVIKGRLEETLGRECYFEPNLALPGFHMWFHPCIFVRPNASVHFDLQYRHLLWPGRAGADFGRVFSFTLPLRLPLAGGGLNTWDISQTTYRSLVNEGVVATVEEVVRLKVVEMAYHPYTVGTLVLSRGTVLHQIAPAPRTEPGDARITLQGHGLWCDGRWLLYW